VTTSAAHLTAEDVSTVVTAAVAIVCERDPATLGPDSTFADLGADSLALVEIAEVIETEIAARTGRRLHIPDDDLALLPSVGATVEYVTART
jgi:acyl carrier protein